MAIARKCDICGRYYDPYNNTGCLRKSNGVTFISVTNSEEVSTNERYDCCPECIEKVSSFIETMKGE